jgi:hypothetical protein|tara:strand:+ start:553 stop:1137 length:585 start_codon:yes stop_codon:yes gene_type:complete
MSLFDTLQAQAFRAGITGNTKSSQRWFQTKVKALSAPSRTALLKDEALKKTANPRVGDMMMYSYDPKHKATLPYYDRFPLTIMVQPAKGGFHGLNLHYLSPGVRARFLDELMALSPSKMTDTSRLAKLRYDLLTGAQKYKEFKPCFKHYLMSQVKSQMVRVPMTEWEIAIFLPVEQFVNVKSQSVWRYSRKTYS